MISNVYNYYLSQYGNLSYGRHNVHKKNELRNTYNSIVKLNRSNPFYDIDLSEESQRYAIDIKENARALFDVTEDLTDAGNGNMTFRSIAKSDMPDNVEVEYIGENVHAGSPAKFTIGVRKLATPQTNTGAYLRQNARNLFTGTYSFDVDISSITYELQFDVTDKDTNRSVQDKLARLINKSNIGLNAQVLVNNSGRSALSVTSNMTGVGDRPVIFRITDNDTSALSGVVDALGLDNTTHYPSNAVFELNGNEKISSSNVFTVDKKYEITLKKANNEGEYATIGLKQNLDSIIDSIHELADSYNQISQLARSGTSSGSRRLANDLSYIATTHNDALNSNGLHINENGFIEIDDEYLHSSSNDELLTTLSSLGRFKSDLQKKANDIMINPMEYISKSIISYKNPARPTADTYTTSIYSGMIYNGYC